MAIGVEAVGGASATSAASVTKTGCTVTAGNRVVLIITYGSSGSMIPSSVTWNGAAANFITGSDVFDGTWTGCTMYEIINPTPGTGSAVGNFPGNLSQSAIHFISVTGVSSVVTPPTTNNGTTANPSVTVSSAAAGDLIIAACCNDNESGTTTEAGTVIFDGENVGSDTDHNSQYFTDAGTHVASWTQSGSGNHWTAVGYALRGAAAGGGGPLLGGALRGTLVGGSLVAG
jgi:hypothetical protein